MALVHSNKASISSSKRPSSRPCKQRSFSSGALPGLHDFQRRQLNPLYRDEPDLHDDNHHQHHQHHHHHDADDEVTPLSPSPSNGALGGEEDCDSGILVSEAASTPLSSLPGCGGGGPGAGGLRGGRSSLPWGAGGQGALSAATAAARALRSASLDRELLGGSPLLDHDEDADDLVTATSHARRSRASTKSSSSSSEISEIFSRFQRRRVAGSAAEAAVVSPRASAAASSSRPSSPPLLPAPPQRTDLSGASSTAAGRRREFHLVRLTRAAPTEELGIFIAKSDAPDRGAQGYVVAHVVPGGLAHRDGQLCLGDELVVVNGRQLRGLSMAAARQRLRAGPTQVDIVIAREPRPGPAGPPPGDCRCRCGEGEGEGRDSGLDTSGSGDSMTDSSPAGCSCKAAGGPAADQTPSPSRRTLPESSVDYENVVLRPRDRTPAASAPASPGTSMPSSSSCTPLSVEAEQQQQQQQQPQQRQQPHQKQDANAPATPSAALLGVTPPGPEAGGGGCSPGPSPCHSLSPSPVPGRQQLFQKHANKPARRSLALVSRSSSPPLENHLEPPGETQHHSLKRRARRPGHGGRHGLGGGEGGGGGGAPPTTEFRVELRKGPGCGALGFTVVGGADSPRGALPIFVRSVLEGGQAAQDGRLQPGDELLLLNGQPLRGATHAEAVAMFRAVRAGPVVLTVCRRTTKKAQSCSDLVVGAQSVQRQGDS
ncbi:PDZ domain-containing protein 2 [Frankliniella fusca]|uniref:PDZ domain-containing protein 2 n=1 Tax=Frankliniella fusca TaxID=407009 RepID=A0AAE1GV59_9NEOP|nr:PDZ domain-containing protein 2 [Frankliniella fusca]